MNDKVEEQACPECGGVRLIKEANTRRKNFTGLCRHCWGIANSRGSRSETQRKKIADSLIKHTKINGTDRIHSLTACRSIHKSLILWYGKPDHCENDPNHIVSRYDRANLTGIYTRNIEDYASLCRTCHRKYDYNRIKVRGLLKSERLALNGIGGYITTTGRVEIHGKE